MLDLSRHGKWCGEAHEKIIISLTMTGCVMLLQDSDFDGRHVFGGCFAI